MICRDVYNLVCKTPVDIASEVEGLVRPEITGMLGASVSAIFPEFAGAFPNALKAIEGRYSAPFLLFKKTSTGWAYFLASESENYNLFFDVASIYAEVRGGRFDAYCSMLPSGWVELYRYFYSFVVTQDHIMPLTWRNTPFSYSRRLFSEEYRRLFGIKKSVMRRFEEMLGSNKINCWVLTDSGDALFLDEMRSDKKVYHVRNNNFEDFFVISDPESILDKYLAHFVITNSSDGFDFRQ